MKGKKKRKKISKALLPVLTPSRALQGMFTSRRRGSYDFLHTMQVGAEFGRVAKDQSLLNFVPWSDQPFPERRVPVAHNFFTKEKSREGQSPYWSDLPLTFGTAPIGFLTCFLFLILQPCSIYPESTYKPCEYVLGQGTKRATIVGFGKAPTWEKYYE